MIPKQEPRLLPDNMAVEATNTNLFSGRLRGWRALGATAALHTFSVGGPYAKVSRLRANDGSEYWYGSTDPQSSVVPNPLVDEAFDRFYFFVPDEPPAVNTVTGLSGGSSPADLALPTPAAAPVLTPLSGAPAGSDPAEDRVYVITWQTEWGEETEPGPTVTIKIKADDQVDLSSIPAPPTIDGRSWEWTNIYRAAAGSSSTDYFFVDRIAAGNTTYSDTLRTAYLAFNRILDAWDNVAPVDGLMGVRVHPSGALCAFKGRQVWFSKTYLPHAWPEDTKLTVDDDIVGLEVFGNNIAVVTTAFVYMIYGSAPGSFGLRKFPVAAPCRSYRSIVGVEEGVFFCSDRGLMFVNESGVQNVTAPVISQDEWRADFAYGDVFAVMYDRLYMALRVGTVVSGATPGFIFDSREQRTFVTKLEVPGTVTSFDIDQYTARPMVTFNTEVFQWDATTEPEVSWTWTSKVFQFGRPVNFGAIMLHGEAGDLVAGTPSCRVIVVAGGAVRFDQTIELNKMRRLPSGFLADEWQVTLETNSRIFDLAMAETGEGLGQV